MLFFFQNKDTKRFVMFFFLNNMNAHSFTRMSQFCSLDNDWSKCVLAFDTQLLTKKKRKKQKAWDVAPRCSPSSSLPFLNPSLLLLFGSFMMMMMCLLFLAVLHIKSYNMVLRIALPNLLTVMKCHSYTLL